MIDPRAHPAVELEAAFLALRRLDNARAIDFVVALANVADRAVDTMLAADPADLQSARGEASMARNIANRLATAEATISAFLANTYANSQRGNSL